MSRTVAAFRIGCDKKFEGVIEMLHRMDMGGVRSRQDGPDLVPLFFIDRCCVRSSCIVEGDVAADRLPCLADAFIGVQIDFLVLDGSPEALDEDARRPCRPC